MLSPAERVHVEVLYDPIRDSWTISWSRFVDRHDPALGMALESRGVRVEIRDDATAREEARRLLEEALSSLTELASQTRESPFGR